MQRTFRSLASLLCAFFAASLLLASTPRPAPLFVLKDVVVRTAEGSITLRAGTPVVVEAGQTFPSKNLSAGQTVPIRCKFNVVVEKKTVISAGSLGSATISNISKPRSFGRGGSIEFLVQSIQSVDGQQVLLSSIPLTVEGDDKKGLAIGLAIGAGLITLPILGAGALVGLLIKGKYAELRAGTTINASVASDMDFDSANLK